MRPIYIGVVDQFVRLWLRALHLCHLLIVTLLIRSGPTHIRNQRYDRMGVDLLAETLNG